MFLNFKHHYPKITKTDSIIPIIIQNYDKYKKSLSVNGFIFRFYIPITNIVQFDTLGEKLQMPLPSHLLPTSLYDTSKRQV